jgi:hypothetical protein
MLNKTLGFFQPFKLFIELIDEEGLSGDHKICIFKLSLHFLQGLGLGDARLCVVLLHSVHFFLCVLDDLPQLVHSLLIVRPL